MNKANCPYRVERITAQRVKDLIILFRDVFEANVTDNFIINKYSTDYTGACHIGYLAYNDENYPIAYHGAIPFLIEYDGHVQVAVQGCDAMTHPQYTGKGLFGYLGKLTEDLLNDKGITLIFGWPNQRSSLCYFKKLNWQQNGLMQRYHIPVSPLPTRRFAQALKKARWLDNKLKQMILSRYVTASSDFNSSVINSVHGGVLRNSGFFAYKRKLGSDIYSIAGCKIWMKIKGTNLLIGDIEATSEEKILTLIKTLRKICFCLGVHEIVFQCSADCYLNTVVSHHFPAHDSWVSGGKVFGPSAPLEMLRFTYGDLDTF